MADHYGHGTSYAFNKANQLTKLTDADGNATSYVLDGVGNATIVIDPNMNRTTQQFDGDHQVTQQITGRMNTLSYGFDGVGRPTSSPNGSFGYNKEGQLTLASNSYGAYSLTYDDGGRVTLVTEPNSLTLNFGYDKAGNRTLVTDSLGGTELSTYDAANFLTSRMYQGQGQTLGVQFTNNAEDWNTTLARYGNGTLVATGETGYDNVGQATTILNTHGTATVDQFLNAYNNGNVTSVIGTQNGSTTTLGLTYDEDNELTGAGTTSYTFDSNGNRTGSAGVTTGNELTSDATWSYTYDADGNLIQKSKGVGGTIITIGLGGGGGGGVGIPGGGETWTYGYNPQDQLTQVQHFTGPLVTLALTVDYDYDAFGNRIETTSIASGTTTVTKDAYDGWDPGQPAPTGNENFNVWAQTNASGTLTSRYLYSDRVDQQLGRIDVNSGTATVYWTLEDYQNSMRDVIDNTGALKDSIQYDAFGNITSETAPTYRGSYAWTGRELDAETDLQYNRARWYDSTTGRWMTRDPLGFDAGDSNLYRYVKNGPTEGMDPSGLQRSMPSIPGQRTTPNWNADVETAQKVWNYFFPPAVPKQAPVAPVAPAEPQGVKKAAAPEIVNMSIGDILAEAPAKNKEKMADFYAAAGIDVKKEVDLNRKSAVVFAQENGKHYAFYDYRLRFKYASDGGNGSILQEIKSTITIDGVTRPYKNFLEGFQLKNGITITPDSHGGQLTLQPGQQKLEIRATIKMGFGTYDKKNVADFGDNYKSWKNYDPNEINWISNTTTYENVFWFDRNGKYSLTGPGIMVAN